MRQAAGEPHRDELLVKLGTRGGRALRLRGALDGAREVAEVAELRAKLAQAREQLRALQARAEAAVTASAATVSGGPTHGLTSEPVGELAERNQPWWHVR